MSDEKKPRRRAPYPDAMVELHGVGENGGLVVQADVRGIPDGPVVVVAPDGSLWTMTPLREDTAPTVIVEGAEAALAGADQHCRSAETMASDPLRPPTVCPTCGSDDPPWIVSSRGKEPALCPDPFHSTVPCPVCGGTGVYALRRIVGRSPYTEDVPCPRGCTPEGAAP